MLAVGDVVEGFEVRLRTAENGPVIASERVKARDLAEPLAELAFEAGLRSTGEFLPVSKLATHARPAYRKDAAARSGEPCDGFVLDARSIIGEVVSCSFDRRVLEPVARRASARLVESGELAEGDLYFYEVEVADGPMPAIDFEAQPFAPELLSIEPFFEKSTKVSGSADQGRLDERYALAQEQGRAGSPDLQKVAGKEEAGSLATAKEAHPVFYRRAAFEKAEHVSRKGGASTPPIETGGVLLARACWCADTRTFFCVVEDVLEAFGSEGTTYSLTFTAETWQRAQSIVRARQRQPATRHQRIAGVAHGHSFLPYSVGETCDGCPAQGTCSLSTAYLSESDRRWSRAVFPREPWQLSQIFGLTPRRERVSAFFGQRAATLERRDYYLLDD